MRAPERSTGIDVRVPSNAGPWAWGGAFSGTACRVEECNVWSGFATAATFAHLRTAAITTTSSVLVAGP
jgi:hypothetical protein